MASNGPSHYKGPLFPWINITFCDVRMALEFGTPEFADELYGAVREGSPIDRYRAAEQALNHLRSEVFAPPHFVEYPIYGSTLCFRRRTSGLIRLAATHC